jgi:hypothetical protein
MPNTFEIYCDNGMILSSDSALGATVKQIQPHDPACAGNRHDFEDRLARLRTGGAGLSGDRVLANFKLRMGLALTGLVLWSAA